MTVSFTHLIAMHWTMLGQAKQFSMGDQTRKTTEKCVKKSTVASYNTLRASKDWDHYLNTGVTAMQDFPTCDDSLKQNAEGTQLYLGHTALGVMRDNRCCSHR